jgi:NAD(P)-dependent dehydrogenase (short-subunit alcohol dehydrogenase family)
MQDLKGRTMIVTGAGQGLGAAISEVLASAGVTVIAADVNIEKTEALVQRLTSEDREAYAVKLDVGEERAAEGIVDYVINRFDKLDGIINNAGIDVTLAIDELPVADWDRVVRTNLRGPFLMAKYATPVMRRQGYGQIVNIVSTAAKRTWPNASAYHASKWGLLGLSHALHAELRPHNIKVTAVIAGGMRTPFLLDRFPDIDPDTLQDAANVAATVEFVLRLPDETVIPEIMVLPMKERSWP